MAIPKNITRDHILKSISNIKDEDIPPERNYRKWAMRYKGEDYPVKLLISWANIYANGEELNSNVFISRSARKYLMKLGFDIIHIK